MPLWTTLEAAPEGPKLGVSMPQESIRDLDISVFPDGTGLPQGKGTAVEGKTQFEALCTRCHGVKGSGGSAEELVGRSPSMGRGRIKPLEIIGPMPQRFLTIFEGRCR